jgi:hypothetical protein
MSARPRFGPGIAAASLALHAALVAAFALTSEPPPMRAGAAGVGVIAVALAAPPGPKVAAAPQPSPEPDETADGAAADAAVAPLDVAEAPATVEAAETAGAPDGGADVAGCVLSDRVLAALLSEAPRAALARIPDRRRSVAGAVMLWDGGWVRTGALAEARIAQPIRAAVVQAVKAAGPACAAAPVAGPVLLIVGSGTWRWADLATDAAAPHPTAAGGR